VGAKLRLLLAMGIFGTVGIFVEMIPLSSGLIALCRAVLGMVFLIPVMMLSKQPVHKDAILKNLPVLLLSGVCLGANWVLLFEAIRYSGVAVATACYYLAPAFLLLCAPIIGEKLTVKKLACVGVALAGMVLVSGVLQGPGDISVGILFGVGAAVLYTSVVVLNKKLRGLGDYETTASQLLIAAVVLLVYVLFTGGVDFTPLNLNTGLILLLVGIVHTGVAYWLYFGSVGKLPAQTVALFSYLDPVVALLCSWVILQQPFDPWMAVGAALILGSTLYSQLTDK
jgi:RarD protein